MLQSIPCFKTILCRGFTHVATYVFSVGTLHSVLQDSVEASLMLQFMILIFYENNNNIMGGNTENKRL